METLAHERAQELFGALLDGEIHATEEAGLRAHLTDCVECRTGFDQFEKAISLIRDVGRERAPEGFATRVLRRVRRRRRHTRLQGGRLLFEHGAFPAAEVIVPILIAAAVAALIIFAAP
jgi:anti-sigma factor RsiW